jgi:glycosyltransferase involved in cell wall biosynthesis
MKLDIVMVAMNNSQHVKTSLDSIIKLLNEDVRIVVVDSSLDSQVRAIIEEQTELKDCLSYFWESPQGIYHAMNTGILNCRSDSLVWFLNPGDIAHDVESILELARLIIATGSKWGYGLASYITKQGEVSLFPEHVEPNTLNLFTGKLAISHQSMLVHKLVFDELGFFNPGYKIVADLEFQFKLLAHHVPISLRRHLVEIDTTGVSHSRQLQTLWESFKVRWCLSDFAYHQKLRWLIMKIWIRIRQSKRW